MYYYSVYVNTFKELFLHRKPPHRRKASAKVDIEPETTKQSSKKIQMKNEFFALTDKWRTLKTGTHYYI
ncbi:hyaluronate lyase [Prevotella dentalis DSM 3688]|uniref:Hyaluronate lyase n=1 Tax=Prevotella dentalis (strain ATCC 49559 / DSM 3688 / JCM 13448 / NCTC 12043 / ES 2772) TaxID=908937 RepID=F9D3Y5_PREDD|nr:hyaluronate lyase [Prevotella dentalis DSM 3688]